MSGPTVPTGLEGYVTFGQIAGHLDPLGQWGSSPGASVAITLYRRLGELSRELAAREPIRAEDAARQEAPAAAVGSTVRPREYLYRHDGIGEVVTAEGYEGRGRPGHHPLTRGPEGWSRADCTSWVSRDNRFHIPHDEMLIPLPPLLEVER